MEVRRGGSDLWQILPALREGAEGQGRGGGQLSNEGVAKNTGRKRGGLNWNWMTWEVVDREKDGGRQREIEMKDDDCCNLSLD